MRPHTLRLSEVTLLDTRLESLVELRVELGLAGVADLVVGLDILLDGLTAVGRKKMLVEGFMTRRDREINKNAPTTTTRGRSLPRTIAFLELRWQRRQYTFQ